MAVGWGFPYGCAAFYDFLQGQGYLPVGSLTISQIVPNWVNWLWLAIGVLAFMVITFEGSYRWVNSAVKRLVKPAESDKVAELRYEEKQIERSKERQRRVEVYGDISLLLKQSRETVVPAAMTVDVISIPQDKVQETTQHIITKYVEGDRHALDFTQEELQNDIRRNMEVRHIGISWLKKSKPEISPIIDALNDKCSNVRNFGLGNFITQFRDSIITQASMELYAQYLKSQNDARIELMVLRGREYWSDELDKLQVKINALVDSLLGLEDLK